MNWIPASWKRRAVAPFWLGLLGLSNAFAAGFAPLAFQDPFPPAATPGLPLQPAGEWKVLDGDARALVLAAR